jgi:hypothetical protein
MRNAWAQSTTITKAIMIIAVLLIITSIAMLLSTVFVSYGFKEKFAQFKRLHLGRK